jgi:hypothetical protein
LLITRRRRLERKRDRNGRLSYSFCFLSLSELADALIIMEVIPDTARITGAAVMVRTDAVMPLTLAMVPIQALSRSRLEIGRTILGALAIT